MSTTDAAPKCPHCGSPLHPAVDDFLRERAVSVLSPSQAAPVALRQEPQSKQEWFKGSATGSFDGSVLEVDFRGALPQLKLVLSAGGAELDCVCREDQLEEIRASLKRRVRIYGQAFYDGKSGLPRRLMVSHIDRLEGQGDLAKWKGAFEPFEPTEWETDDPSE